MPDKRWIKHEFLNGVANGTETCVECFNLISSDNVKKGIMYISCNGTCIVQWRCIVCFKKILLNV